MIDAVCFSRFKILISKGRKFEGVCNRISFGTLKKIKMTVEVANGVAETVSLPNGDLKSQNPSGGAKKLRETERRRRRRKQKKNKKNAAAGDDSDTATEDANGVADESSKENSDPQKVV